MERKLKEARQRAKEHPAGRRRVEEDLGANVVEQRSAIDSLVDLRDPSRHGSSLGSQQKASVRRPQPHGKLAASDGSSINAVAQSAKTGGRGLEAAGPSPGGGRHGRGGGPGGAPLVGPCGLCDPRGDQS